jgi:hypothetical protein
MELCQVNFSENDVDYPASLGHYNNRVFANFSKCLFIRCNGEKQYTEDISYFSPCLMYFDHGKFFLNDCNFVNCSYIVKISSFLYCYSGSGEISLDNIFFNSIYANTFLYFPDSLICTSDVYINNCSGTITKSEIFGETILLTSFSETYLNNNRKPSHDPSLLY